jgi:hypothetical protein
MLLRQFPPFHERHMMTFGARAAGTLAAALALLVSVIGGAMTPGHSHAAGYISELGARGAPYGEVVSIIGFLPIGLASLIALVASTRLEANRKLQASALWMLTVPVACIVAAFARCAPGLCWVLVWFVALASPEDRVVFPFVLSADGQNYKVGLGNAADSPWSDATLPGRILDRGEALKHAWVKDASISPTTWSRKIRKLSITFLVPPAPGESLRRSGTHEVRTRQVPL